jgi:hypothetical protein
MAHKRVFSVEIHRIALVNSLKDFGKGSCPGFNQQMYVIIHEHEGIDQETVLVSIMRDDFQKFPAICLIPEYRLPLIPTDNYVIECAREFYSRFPSHARKISALSSNVNKQV